MYLLDIEAPHFKWPGQEQKDVFCQVGFVDKNNLEAQNPRRDTGIPSVSAGLLLPRNIMRKSYFLFDFDLYFS